MKFHVIINSFLLCSLSISEFWKGSYRAAWGHHNKHERGPIRKIPFYLRAYPPLIMTEYFYCKLLSLWRISCIKWTLNTNKRGETLRYNLFEICSYLLLPYAWRWLLKKKTSDNGTVHDESWPVISTCHVVNE